MDRVEDRDKANLGSEIDALSKGVWHAIDNFSVRKPEFTASREWQFPTFIHLDGLSDVKALMSPLLLVLKLAKPLQPLLDGKDVFAHDGR